MKICNERFKDNFDISTAIGKDTIVATCLLPKYKLNLTSIDKPTKLEVKDICIKMLCSLSKNSLQQIDNHDIYDSKNYINLNFNEPYLISLKDLVKLELETFFRNQNTNIHLLNSWPNLRNLFLKLNVKKCSFASSERLFSDGGNILTPRRGRMNNKIFERLFMLRGNRNII